MSNLVQGLHGFLFGHGRGRGGAVYNRLDWQSTWQKIAVLIRPEWSHFHFRRTISIEHTIPLSHPGFPYATVAK